MPEVKCVIGDGKMKITRLLAPLATNVDSRLSLYILIWLELTAYIVCSECFRFRYVTNVNHCIVPKALIVPKSKSMRSRPEYGKNVRQKHSLQPLYEAPFMSVPPRNLLPVLTRNVKMFRVTFTNLKTRRSALLCISKRDNPRR